MCDDTFCKAWRVAIFPTKIFVSPDFQIFHFSQPCHSFQAFALCRKYHRTLRHDHAQFSEQSHGIRSQNQKSSSTIHTQQQTTASPQNHRNFHFSHLCHSFQASALCRKYHRTLRHDHAQFSEQSHGIRSQNQKSRLADSLQTTDNSTPSESSQIFIFASLLRLSSIRALQKVPSHT